MKAGQSRPVSSNQAGTHPDVLLLAKRHLQHAWRRPVSDHGRAEFERCLPTLAEGAERLILDAGCGTGDSSRLLARQYPDHLVLGVDQSSHRLGRRRAQPEPENLLLLRADLQDFWRLLHDAGFRLQRHFLLYPNPWPRKQHLQRRWHGHPVLPWLLALGGVLELRSNWPVYVAEFAMVLELLNIPYQRGQVAQPGLSPFERKYALSGHALHCLQADLQAAAIDVPGPSVFPGAAGKDG